MENGKNCKNINFPIVFQDVENHKMNFYFLFCVSIFPIFYDFFSIPVIMVFYSFYFYIFLLFVEDYYYRKGLVCLQLLKQYSYIYDVLWQLGFFYSVSMEMWKCLFLSSALLVFDSLKLLSVIFLCIFFVAHFTYVLCGGGGKLGVFLIFHIISR